MNRATLDDPTPIDDDGLDLRPGSVIPVRICPFGEFPGRAGKKRVTQICDRKAFDAIARNASGEILVDFEHNAENGGPTDAAAWISDITVKDDGLWGLFKLTDAGADALRNRRLRFLSPAWDLDGEGRPERLVSVALTNKPNIPAGPVLNRADQDDTPPTVEEKGHDMTPEIRAKILELLGLPAEASDEDIVTAITTVKNNCDELQEKALNAEAEAAADENKDLVANRADFIAAYKRDPQTVRMVLNSVAAPKHDTQQTPKPATRVLNRAEAARPNIPGLTCPDVDPLAKCRTPEERIAARTGRHL